MENTEFKHTPGPWATSVRVDATENTTNPIVFAKSTIGKSSGMTRVLLELDDTLYSPFLGQQEANAKIIAAAPELLEAILKIKEFIRCPTEMSGLDFNNNYMNQLESAIKKATE